MQMSPESTTTAVSADKDGPYLADFKTLLGGYPASETELLSLLGKTLETLRETQHIQQDSAARLAILHVAGTNAILTDMLLTRLQILSDENIELAADRKRHNETMTVMNATLLQQSKALEEAHALIEMQEAELESSAAVIKTLRQVGTSSTQKPEPSIADRLAPSSIDSKTRSVIVPTAASTSSSHGTSSRDRRSHPDDIPDTRRNDSRQKDKREAPDRRNDDYHHRDRVSRDPNSERSGHRERSEQSKKPSRDTTSRAASPIRDLKRKERSRDEVSDRPRRSSRSRSPIRRKRDEKSPRLDRGSASSREENGKQARTDPDRTADRLSRDKHGKKEQEEVMPRVPVERKTSAPTTKPSGLYGRLGLPLSTKVATDSSVKQSQEMGLSIHGRGRKT